jgi:hypothetical protein
MADTLDCILSEPMAVVIYVQVKEAEPPAAMGTDDTGPDTYNAEPVPPIVSGDDKTLLAAAEPVLLTVMITSMSLPTGTAAGTETSDTRKAVAGVFVIVGVAVLVKITAVPVCVTVGVFVSVGGGPVGDSVGL